jgi:hypothetical protein
LARHLGRRKRLLFVPITAFQGNHELSAPRTVGWWTFCFDERIDLVIVMESVEKSIKNSLPAISKFPKRLWRSAPYTVIRIVRKV